MFVRNLILTIGFLTSFSSTAFAQTIGVSLPLSGDFKELGMKFRQGVEIAASQLNADVELVFVDDGCNANMAQQATSQLIAKNADIITGFLCNDSAIVSATQVSELKIPLLVSGARSVRLIKDRERESWNIWRLAPGDDYPVATAATTIAKNWKDIPFALVDDGTIYGRSFTDQLRFQLDNLELKPQFSDSFRAAQSTQAGLLRRLQRSGVTSVLIASATLEDLQTIAIDNTRLETGLSILATEALMALPHLETADEILPGINVIGWPLSTVPELDQYLDDNTILPNQLIYDGYATLQIALAAVGQSPAETTNNLSSQTFDTVLGNIRFQPDGAAAFNPYKLLEWNGQNFSAAQDEAATQ